MDNFISQVAIFIKEISYPTRGRDMERCFGLIVRFIRVSGKEEFKMERDRYIWLVERY